MDENGIYEMKKLIFPIIAIVASISIAGQAPIESESHTDSYWLLFRDDTLGCGYLNSNGDTMIPPGKYMICYTDTFRNYAVVLGAQSGLIGINKREETLYKVFVFDNGPDYPSEGLFRIWRNGKMGYADERTGKIILYPQFTCGFPFENGKAKVSLTSCESVPVDKDGEHHRWETEGWFYIDHTGKKVDSPNK